MKRTPLLLLIIAILAAAPFFAPIRAHAAKMLVSWTPPTQNTDGSPLTDLTSYRVEWGSCGPNGAFGTLQSSITVGATITSTWIYPTGLNPVCVRAYAINAQKMVSAPSAVAQGSSPPTLGKPVQ